MHRSFSAKYRSKRQPRRPDGSGDKNERAVFPKDFSLKEVVFLERNVLTFKKLSYFLRVDRMLTEAGGKTKCFVAVVSKIDGAAQSL